MTYAIVVDDEILKIGQRPKAWRNHTGLQYATDEQLAAIGILAVVDVPTVVWTPRAFTVDELAARTRNANRDALTDLQVLTARIADIKTFLTDPDVIAAENQPNATALTAQQQNRFNKAVARQLRRNANMDVRLFRYVFGQLHGTLLDDVADA
jgi:hypothetical protein